MYFNHHAAWPTIGIVERYAKPQWPDGCEHGLADFVGSMRVVKSVRESVTVDVYVFKQITCHSVCIRVGPEGENYISPGTVLDTIHSALAHCRAEHIAAAILIDEAFMLQPQRRDK